MRNQFLFLVVIMLLCYCYSSSAQNMPHNILFDFAKADTADFRIMVLQINNVLKDAPSATIEVEFYGPGLLMLVADKNNVAQEMEEIQKASNISFAACANTMRRMNIDKSRILPFAKIVPVAMLELSSLQQEDWSYSKSRV
jgi:intracellular sulfur oxidation DsrE/DsrF family protein